MDANELSPEQRSEIVQIVLKYRRWMLADVCEPECPVDLWTDLCDWMEENK